MNWYSPRMTAALAVGSLSLLAACGSTSNAATNKDNGVATIKTVAQSSTNGGSATASTKPAAADEAGIKWAGCMRDNGVDMADPTVDANGNMQIKPPTGAAANSPKFSDAMKACQKLLAGTTFGANGGPQQAKLKDALVEFSGCLRKQGLNVGDVDLSGPPPGGGQGSGQGGAVSADPNSLEFLAKVVPGLDPKDPKTQPAVDICRPKLLEVLNNVQNGG
jgi:hypothetical protein